MLVRLLWGQRQTLAVLKELVQASAMDEARIKSLTIHIEGVTEKLQQVVDESQTKSPE